MRITLEPSTRENTSGQHKVVIESPYDDLTLDDVVALLESMLCAYGYAYESVHEALNGTHNFEETGTKEKTND